VSRDDIAESGLERALDEPSVADTSGPQEQQLTIDDALAVVGDIDPPLEKPGG
jgi:hypothetical protein